MAGAGNKQDEPGGYSDARKQESDETKHTMNDEVVKGTQEPERVPSGHSWDDLTK